MTFKIEAIRRWRVSTPRSPYPHHERGFLVTGYPDGSDWLVSTTGRGVHGRAFRWAPDLGWAIAWDSPSDYERPRLHILDFPEKSMREVEGLSLPLHHQVVDDYDGEHLVILAPAESADDKWGREVIVIDIAAARTVHRFPTSGIAFLFFGPTARTPEGRLKKFAHGRDPARDAWAPGFVAIHPLRQEYAFQPFPLLGGEDMTISPSGRWVLRETRGCLPVREPVADRPRGWGRLSPFAGFTSRARSDAGPSRRRYGRCVQLWSGETLVFQRNLILGWFDAAELAFLPGDDAVRRRNLDALAALCASPRADPLIGPERTADKFTRDPELREITKTHWDFARFPWGAGAAPLVWQDDETAFWWNWLDRWTCVGLDGELSPPIFAKGKLVSFVAKSGRIGEAVVELEERLASYVIDGSPSADLHIPRHAPAPTPISPDPQGDRRQRKAQAALTRIVKSATQLRISIASPQVDDCIRAIDAITSALDRGLKSYADDDGVLQLRIDVAGERLDEARFFARVESLGAAAAPALNRLIDKCCADPGMRDVWSGELEEGRQAFGAAAKALGAIDAGAWPRLARYLMHVDDAHEGFFRGDTERHFIARHGWRDESFNLSLAVIVQTRGNLGDNYVPVWKDLGLSAAAERAHSPAEFATRMLAIRDRMVAEAAGSFAEHLARAETGRDRVHGWRTYDDLFEQIRGAPTPWEIGLFEELARRSAAA